MYKTENSLVFTKGYLFYKSLLLLYPDSYRRKFGEEMLIIYEDMYQEKLSRDGRIGITFWFSVCLDIIKSAGEQHGQLLKRQGMRKYLFHILHINKYNIIGALLLLPFFSVFLIDLIARIAQGDLTHYNRPVYAFLSHTLFYWFPVMFVWIILFPALAILINLIPLIKNSLKKHSILQFIFVKQNSVTLAIVLAGVGFLAIVGLHDFAPCFVHGLLRVGVGRLPQIISVCRNA